MDFFAPEAHSKVEAAVAAIEAQTAAEVVVAVRVQAGDYRVTEVAFGAAAAFVTLLVLLFYPRSFSVAAMPIDVALVFGFARLACRRIPGLRRLFSSRRDCERQLQLTAKAAFVDLGVSRTSGRTGLLVLVGVFERDVAIIADVNVPASVQTAVAGLRTSVRGNDADAFAMALLALGPLLAAALPRADDDIDELANAPSIQ